MLKFRIYGKQVFVYVIVWVAIVFGINSVSNGAGRKIVMVQGIAEYYYSFLPALRVLLIPNTMQ